MKTEIEIKQVMGHYEIYYHGIFECTCDPGELSEVLKEIEEKYNGKD